VTYRRNNKPTRDLTGFADEHDSFGDIPGVMMPWFNDEHEDLYGHPAAKGEGVLMGAPVWGIEYIDRFAAYTIPTLMAPANLAALKDRCRLVIYTEPDAISYLHRLTGWVRRAGIEVIFRIMPNDVMGMLARGDYASRFRTLGVVGNVLTHMAGRSDMGFHMLQPDHLYGHQYFPNLFRLAKEHDAITQMGLNATTDGINPELEKFRTNTGALAIPDLELGDMSFRHMHPQCQLHSMNVAKFPEKLPQSHRLWWQGKNAVHIHSAHTNAAWLAPALCLDAPISFTSTMDTLLPEYIPPDVSVYTPTVEDQMTFAEFSDSEKPANRPYVGFDEFANNFWGASSFTGEYMPYFDKPSLVPIKPKASFITDDEIKRQFSVLRESLLKVQDSVFIDWGRKKYSSRFARAAALPEVMR
jgi:hypothetical protein